MDTMSLRERARLAALQDAAQRDQAAAAELDRRRRDAQAQAVQRIASLGDFLGDVHTLPLREVRTGTWDDCQGCRVEEWALAVEPDLWVSYKPAVVGYGQHQLMLWQPCPQCQRPSAAGLFRTLPELGRLVSQTPRCCYTCDIAREAYDA